MINRIVNTYLDNLANNNIIYDKTFKETEFDRIYSIFNMVNLPDRIVNGNYVDINNLSKNAKKLYDSFEDCCYSPDNALVCVDEYSIGAYITGMLVEKLYIRCLIENVTIPQILYIDTEQLVSDLGNLITKSTSENGRAPKIKNSLDIIYDYIYSARYVFWDRFRLDFSPYYNNYIYEILKSRYNDCLGNMFFTDKHYDMFLKGLDKNTLGIINIKCAYNLIQEQQQGNIKLIGGINNVR